MKLKPAVPLILLLLSLLLAAGCSGMPDTINAGGPTAGSAPPFAAAKKGLFSREAPAPDSVTIPAGTPISVRLQNAVSSASARPGDEFAAVIDEPIVVDGRTVVPRGAGVTGRVVAARSSGRLHNSGYLRLALATIDVNGKATPIHSSSVFIMGGAHKKRNLALIGGGTGAGALIGAIAGGGKGALIGSAMGAAGGTAGAYATGKKDVGFAAERRLTFRLTQPLVAKG